MLWLRGRTEHMCCSYLQRAPGLADAQPCASLDQMASKWRLTKKDEKEVEDHAQAARQQAVDEGASKGAADKAYNQAKAEKTKELKEEKAARAAANAKAKAAGAASPANPPSGAAAPAQAALLPGVTPVVVPSGANQCYYEEVLAAQLTIFNHPTFGRMASESPLDITDDVAKESGCQDVWTREKCKTALEREGCYRSAVNLFWVDLFGNVTPSVPLSLKRAKAWAEVFFHDGPRHLKDVVEIAVSHHDYDLDACKGKWALLSPAEQIHGILLHLAGRVDSGAEDSELRAWKRVLLSTPAMVQVVAGDKEMYWASYEARQHIVQNSDSFKRTARQMAYEVVYFRDHILGNPNIDVRMLQEEYTKRSNAESTKRDMSDSFIKDAVTVHDKLLVDEACSAVLDLLENEFGSLDHCLNSHVKLKILIDKTDGFEMRRWVMHGIADALLAAPPLLQNDQVGKSWFSGGANSVSGVDLLKLRKVVGEILLRQELPKRGFELKDLQLIGDKMLTHVASRLCSRRGAV